MVSNILSSACSLKNSKQKKNSSSFTSFACSNILKVWTKNTHFRELLINHQLINNPHWYLVQNSNRPGSRAIPTPPLTRGGDCEWLSWNMEQNFLITMPKTLRQQTWWSWGQTKTFLISNLYAIDLVCSREKKERKKNVSEMYGCW